MKFTVFFTTILFLFFFVPLFSRAEVLSHENAVKLARSGDLNKAIGQLETLLQQHPDNKAIAHDLIVIYSWNGQYQQACSLFEQQRKDSCPPYVQLAVQKAYRDLNRPDQALSIINNLLEKQPEETELLLLKGLLHVDKLELQEAEKIIELLSRTAEKDTGYYRLAGYLHARQKKWSVALSDYQALSRLHPYDRESVLEQFTLLKEIFAGEAAGDILARYSQWFSRADKAELLQKQAAARLRWGAHAARTFEETRLFSIQALAMQINALDLINTGRKDKQWPAHTLNDIIVTLHNLRQTDDVELVFRYLTKQGEVPRYARLVAADAMLTNRQPEKARELYQEILRKEPGKEEAQVGLFYCFIEEDDFQSAYRLADDILEKEPVFIWRTNNKARVYNYRYLDWSVYRILARLYGDQAGDAWPEIDRLVLNAPNNTWLREVRGQVANARGWPRLALDDYHYALLLDPDNVDIAAGKASILLQQQQYAQAGALLESLKRVSPEEEVVIDLEREWRFSKKNEGWAEIVFRSTSDSEFNGDSMISTVEILSRPVNDSLHIKAFYRHAWEKFQEEEETFRHYSFSLDYRLMDWKVRGQATYNDSSATDGLGGSIRFAWMPDDFWTIALSGERFSVDATPLSGMNQGVRTDTLAAEAEYRQSEQFSLSAGINRTIFTDGNKGLAGSLALTQRFVDTSHVDLDGTVEVYGSVNSVREAAYFLPEQDLSMKGILHLDHTYFRHYDDRLQQQIECGYGIYGQKEYDPDWVGYIRYEHLYEHAPWAEISAGIELGRNVYDGESESYRQVHFMLNWKF